MICGQKNLPYVVLSFKVPVRQDLPVTAIRYYRYVTGTDISFRPLIIFITTGPVPVPYFCIFGSDFFSYRYVVFEMVIHLLLLCWKNHPNTTKQKYLPVYTRTVPVLNCAVGTINKMCIVLTMPDKYNFLLLVRVSRRCDETCLMYLIEVEH
jgi:hypothetical protein